MLKPLRKSPPFNWSKLISSIERAGWTQREIAELVGAASSQLISEVKRGKSKEPRGMVAVQLYALHRRVLRDQKRRAQRRALRLGRDA